MIKWNYLFTGGVFIVIFVGIALAILTLVFEYVYYKDKKQSRVSSATTEAQMKLPVKVKQFDQKHDESKAYIPIS
jgi:heme/copper-type cytochrome/quinol oxidase subunit 1